MLCSLRTRGANGTCGAPAQCKTADKCGGPAFAQDFVDRNQGSFLFPGPSPSVPRAAFCGDAVR